MRTIAQELRINHRPERAESADAGRPLCRQNRSVHSISYRGMVRQAAQGMFDANAQQRDCTCRTGTQGLPAYDFGRIPVHAKACAEVGPKLKIGAAGDRCEQQADRMADRVMRARVPCAWQVKGGADRLRMKPTPAGAGIRTGDVSPVPGRGGVKTGGEVNFPVLGGAGVPLAGSLRSLMEMRFRHDFGAVRIHTGTASARIAAALSAHAFTVGEHIGFGRSQFAPHTRRGRRLLAHELAHVVQNSRSRGLGAEDVIRCEGPDSPKGEKKKRFEWEDDYYYDLEDERIAKLRVEKLKETWTDARYVEVTVKGKKKWQVQKLGPRKEGAKAEPVEGKPKGEGEKKEEGWTPDSSRYEKAEDAEARKKVLVGEDEWEQYRVKDFKEGEKTFYRVETRGKLTPGTAEFALTFDDGPHSASLGKGLNRTEKVLDSLTAEGIQGKGAFFVQTHAPYRGSTRIGMDLIKRMFSEGYTVGIHTGGPKDHEAHGAAQKAGRLESELTAAKSHLKGISGSDPDLVRAPYGKTNAAVRKVYAKLRLKHLHWDIDGDPGGSHPLAKLRSFFDVGLAALKRGSKGTFHPKPTTGSSRIVLLYHDIRKGTSDNIAAMIKYIRKRVPKAKFGKP